MRRKFGNTLRKERVAVSRNQIVVSRNQITGETNASFIGSQNGWTATLGITKIPLKIGRLKRCYWIQIKRWEKRTAKDDS
jgi:hypothetical protein